MMKKSIAALVSIMVLTLAAGSYLQAQHKGHGAGDGRGPGMCEGRECPMMNQMLPRHLGYLKEELNLTDDQIEKTLNLNAQYMFKVYKERENRDRVDALRKERRAEFQKLLTPEQNEKYKKLVEKFKDRGTNREKGAGKDKGRGMMDCPECF